MSQEIVLFVAGAIVGLASSLISSLVSHLLELRREKVKWERELRMQESERLIVRGASSEDVITYSSQQPPAYEMKTSWLTMVRLMLYSLYSTPPLLTIMGLVVAVSVTGVLLFNTLDSIVALPLLGFVVGLMFRVFRRLAAGWMRQL